MSAAIDAGTSRATLPDGTGTAADYLRRAVLESGTGAEWPRQAYPCKLSRIGIVGAGTMGAGIALAFLNSEVPVVMLDRTGAALELGRAAVAAACDSARRKGRITEPEIRERLSLLHTTLHWSALRDCDLVIEAVDEHVLLKREVLSILGGVCKPTAVIASCTSSLPLDRLAAASGRPEDVVGMHFMAPAHVRPVIEIVRGMDTSERALFVAREAARLVRHIPVLSGANFCFTGNRLLSRLHREAEFLFLEGTPVERIDGVLEHFGFAMGPFRTLDLVGLDVAVQVLDEGRRLLRPIDHPAFRVATRRLHAMRRLGQKSRAGFYAYEGRTATPDPVVERLGRTLAERHGVARRQVDDKEILERCLYPMIAEGWRALREGCAKRESDIDLLWTYGYGFPAALGGPMRYGRCVGVETIRKAMGRYAQRLGNRYGYWDVEPV